MDSAHSHLHHMVNYILWAPSYLRYNLQHSDGFCEVGNMVVGSHAAGD